MNFLKKSQWLSAALALFVAFSLFFSYVPVAKAATTGNGTINIAEANLRQSPSTASAILCKMEKGASVTVQGDEENAWYKVKYQDKAGYVRADYVDVLVTGLSDAAVMISDATIMKDYSTASEQVGTVKAKALVTITGSYGGMYQIKAGTNTGYVVKETVHKYSVMKLNQKGTINSPNVNLRKSPSTSSETIVIMKKNTSVTVNSVQDHWAKIDYAGKTGYVRGDFITYTVPSDAHITAISPGMTGQAVINLQIALRKKGYFLVAANGIYGSATRAAVAKFQSFAYLKADGMAGPQTLVLLFGVKGAQNLWNNYRSSMAAQKPRKSGKVWLEDWFGYMEKTVKRYQPFDVIDVRTGIHWRMQRFGGWWHADVETMNKSDTAAMTKAWGGTLNPSRRPVWVKINGKYYAAALMGYVHNTDTISTNGMDGQICMHFRGSKIHASGHIDEAHQACILEAISKAGRLNDYIEKGLVP
jgi:uncharacterized protein YgiM (DUF1202 family)